MKKPYVIAPADRLGLSRSEAAEYVGLGLTLFEDMVEAGLMPKPKKVKSRLVWSRLALEKEFAELPEDGQDKKKAGQWSDLVA